MFREWLCENQVDRDHFTGRIFPKASDREFWESKYDPEYMKEMEQYLHCDWPIIRAGAYREFFISGDRLACETPYFQRRQALTGLVIGEVLEYRGRFLPDIVDGIFAICEESFWGVSAHKAGFSHKQEILPDVSDPYIDLFASNTAEMISVTYYLLYDALKEFCPEILDRMEYELEVRVKKPYCSHRDFWWMGYFGTVNNWNPWILSNILTVFLMTPSSKREFEDAVTKLLYEAEEYYLVTPSDGGCDEGPSYWMVAGGKLFELCELLYIATCGKINFFADEKIEKIGKYIYRAYIGNGYFANYADGVAKPISDSADIALLFLYGRRIADERLIAFAKELHSFRKTTYVVSGLPHMKRCLYDLILRKEMAAVSDWAPEEAAVFPELQTSYVRNGDWYYSAKGGTNHESHNHNDVGSFIVCHHNMPVLVDPGCGVYTRKTFSSERYQIWTMQSGWHNLPEVNGFEQIDNGKAIFQMEKKKTRIEFASVYPEKAGLRGLERNISLIENGVQICDSFSFLSGHNRLSEHFITAGDLQKDGNRVLISGQYALECSIPCQIVFDEVDFCGDVKLSQSWGTEKLNRMQFIFDCKEQQEVTFKICEI